MKLYDYPRSTACYRVRLALHLKQLPYETIPVHLLNHGGEQNTPEYEKINPQKLVPSLEVKGGIITQSLAIIAYLDNVFPEIPLLPEDPVIRATLQSMALIIACDMHPLNNLRVLNQLKAQFNADETQVNHWYHHWLKSGFDAFEAHLNRLPRNTPLCYGDLPSLADICLIPQVFNAKRFNFSMQEYPAISAINEYCLSLPAFKAAAPEL